MSLNKDEIGQIIRVNFGEDISLSTPTLILEPQIGEKKEITDGVTIPAVPATENGVTFSANEYIEYTTVEDDLDYAGHWRKKGKLEFSSSDIEQSNYERFTVLD